MCGPALDTGLPVLTIHYSAMQSVLYLPYLNLEVPLDDGDRMQQAVDAVASHINLEWKEPLLNTIEAAIQPAGVSAHAGGARPQSQQADHPAGKATNRALLKRPSSAITAASPAAY